MEVGVADTNADDSFPDGKSIEGNEEGSGSTDEASEEAEAADKQTTEQDSLDQKSQFVVADSEDESDNEVASEKSLGGATDGQSGDTLAKKAEDEESEVASQLEASSNDGDNKPGEETENRGIPGNFSPVEEEEKAGNNVAQKEAHGEEEKKEEPQDAGAAGDQTGQDKKEELQDAAKSDEQGELSAPNSDVSDDHAEPEEPSGTMQKIKQEETIEAAKPATSIGEARSIQATESTHEVTSILLSKQATAESVAPVDHMHATEHDKTMFSEQHDEPLPMYKYVEVKSKTEQLKKLTANFVFGLAVVDFDHIKGPELTYWLDDDVINIEYPQEQQSAIDEKVKHYSKVWPYLPFQALPDGVHMYDETFTQFTLCYDELRKNNVELSFDKIDIVTEGDGNEEENEEAKEEELIEQEGLVGVENADNHVDEFENVDLTPASCQPTISRDEKRPIIVMEDPHQGIVTLFGCACIRQVESTLLKNVDQNMLKRSVVQKSVILLTRSPLPIQLREKLSIITQSWFEQFDFTDLEILKALYNDLSTTYNKQGYRIEDDDLYDVKKKNDGEVKIIKESDFYMGLNFQKVVQGMRRHLLTIFKCLLLGDCRILFFSKDLNELSNSQYCVIGLISNLLLNLEDCGFPLIDKHLHELNIKTQSLKGSDRSSILKFLGLPLDIFGIGAFFQPYLTLQQLSYITNTNTKSFVVGSSNDIILEHKKEWFDIVVYLDEKENGLFGSLGSYYNGCKIEILDKKLKDKLSLTWYDKKFIDYIIDCVESHYSNDEKEERDELETEELEQSKTNLSEGSSNINSKTVNSNLSIDNGIYKGGDDFVRSQFEDYLVGFLSCVKYDIFLQREKEKQQQREVDLVQEHLKLDLYENDVNKFNSAYVELFKTSCVFTHWNQVTEDELFNFFEPRHLGKKSANHGNEAPKFKGGEVIKGWFSKLREASAPTKDSVTASHDVEDKDLVEEDKERNDNRDKSSEENLVSNPAAVPNSFRDAMNSWGRDVGGLFAGSRAEVTTETDKPRTGEDITSLNKAKSDKSEGVEKLRSFFAWNKR